MAQALRTVATLPFHLVQDTWRWKIFTGQVPVDKWNSEFWKQKYATFHIDDRRIVSNDIEFFAKDLIL